MERIYLYISVFHTWHEVGGGKDPFLYLSAFSKKFLRRHGELQSVSDDLSCIQSLFTHHQRLDVPRVLLSKAVTYFLEGHRVQSLCVWEEKTDSGQLFNCNIELR